MKIFSFWANGERRLGILDGDIPRELGPALKARGLPEEEISLLERGFFRKTALEKFLGESRPLAKIPGLISFGLPIARPGKILAIGKNFAAHAAEFGSEAPKEPMFFAKLGNCLVPYGEPIRIPHWLYSRFDHEAELALIVGRPGKNIPAEKAFDHVAGYTVFNDVTARKMQGDDRKEGHPWLRSKSLDTSGPCGPFWVPADFLPDPGTCEIACRVNGELRQSAKASEMVHSIPKILSYVSRFMKLETGDLVSLGTPSGVGPLLPGDVVECEVSGIGKLVNPVEREKLEGSDPSTLAALDKEKLFTDLKPRIEKALAGAKNAAERYLKAVDLLHASLPHFNWTGIYELQGNTLHLGPYRGKPTEHMNIPVGKGVCGRAVAERRSLVVEDVTRESNYLACSVETRSEIVVPIFSSGVSSGKITGEIDVDSDLPGAFDERDRKFLEEIAALL